MKPRSVIYVGGPDRDRLSEAIYAVARELRLMPFRQPARGKRAKDDRAWVSVRADKNEARVVASQARKLAKNADAHCRVEEEAAA
jgi:hypothetical protein